MDMTSDVMTAVSGGAGNSDDEHALNQEDLAKDIEDCNYVLNEMDACTEILDAITPVLARKTKDLSFLRKPLPKVKDLNHSTDIRRVEKSLRAIIRTSADKKRRRVPRFLAQYVNFLADPGTPIKPQKCIEEYDQVLDEMVREHEELCVSKVFKETATLVARLQEEKYQMDLRMDDVDSIVAPHSREERSRLDSYFQTHQTKFEQAYGLQKGAMPYGMRDEKRLFQMHQLSPLFNSDVGKQLRLSQSPNDVASFIFKQGQEYLMEFNTDMVAALGRDIKVDCAAEMQGISKRVVEICTALQCAPSEAWTHLTDILRLELSCETPEDVMTVFRTKILPESNRFQILRFKPQFSGFLQTLTVNFNWKNKCICELQIKLVEDRLAKDDPEAHFVEEVMRALQSESIGGLTEVLTRRKNQIVAEGRLGYEGEPQLSNVGWPVSYQEVLKKDGKDITNFRD